MIFYCHFRDKIGVAKALAKVLIHKDVVEGYVILMIVELKINFMFFSNK